MSRIDQLRDQLGGPHPLAAENVRDRLEPIHQAFIQRATFAVMASSNSDGDCDASPKGGPPGFVKVVDDRTLLIPDVMGNRLFHTYQNFESNPKVGLIFIIPGMEFTVRVNGRVEVVEKDAFNVSLETGATNDDSNLIQGLEVTVQEAYLHCPRCFKHADFWNPATIAANATLSLNDLT